MARKIIYENACDACGAPAPRTNDREYLEATDKDTDLPPWWVELTIRVKQCTSLVTFLRARKPGSGSASRLAMTMSGPE